MRRSALLPVALLPCCLRACLCLTSTAKLTSKLMTPKRGGLLAFSAPLGLTTCFASSETVHARKATSGLRMMSGWGGGGSSAARGEKGRRGSGWGGKRQFDDDKGDGGGSWDSSRGEGGGGGVRYGAGQAYDGGGWRDSARGGRGGGRDEERVGRGGRGGERNSGWSSRGGGVREDLTKEEIWEKQRERQAVQAERQSWLAIQNERYPDSDYLFGVAPVLAALRTQRRDMFVLYVQDTMDMEKRKDKGAVEDIKRMADSNGCVIEEVDKGRLNVMSGDRPHQGFVLQCKPLEFVEMSQMDPINVESDKPHPLWLVLDEVKDPHNFGALVRSAYFLGCEGVITCAKNSATISPTMSKASAGAVELLPIHSTKNLMRFLDTSKENGWQVLGAALSKDSVGAADVKLDKPSLLVMGNEGRGLRTNVLRCCDIIVEIEGGKGLNAGGFEEGDDEVLDSLNVSVAGGILLHRLLCSR